MTKATTKTQPQRIVEFADRMISLHGCWKSIRLVSDYRDSGFISEKVCRRMIGEIGSRSNWGRNG